MACRPVFAAVPPKGRPVSDKKCYHGSLIKLGPVSTRDLDPNWVELNSTNWKIESRCGRVGFPLVELTHPTRTQFFQFSASDSNRPPPWFESELGELTMVELDGTSTSAVHKIGCPLVAVNSTTSREWKQGLRGRLHETLSRAVISEN